MQLLFDTILFNISTFYEIETVTINYAGGKCSGVGSVQWETYEKYLKVGNAGPPMSREVLGIQKLAWTASLSFSCHPLPSLSLPSLPTLTPTPSLPSPTSSSRDFIEKFKLVWIKRPFLFSYISFTLFDSSPAHPAGFP